VIIWRAFFAFHIYLRNLKNEVSVDFFTNLVMHLKESREVAIGLDYFFTLKPTE